MTTEKCDHCGADAIYAICWDATAVKDLKTGRYEVLYGTENPVVSRSHSCEDCFDKVVDGDLGFDDFN